MATTTNYGMPKPTDDDLMSDVSVLNSIWTDIANIPRQNIVSSLPSADFSYSVGDRVYHSGLKSTFVLISQTSNWGNVWRPVQTKYSPWMTLPSTILTDAVTYSISNLQYRVTNTGKFILRGAVTRSGTFADFASTGTVYSIFQNLPTELAPSHTLTFMVSTRPQSSALATPMQTRMVVAGTAIALDVWNPGGAANALNFDGVEWVLGTNQGYGSNT